MEIPLSPSNISQFGFYDNDLDELLDLDAFEAEFFADPMSEMSALSYPNINGDQSGSSESLPTDSSSSDQLEITEQFAPVSPPPNMGSPMQTEMELSAYTELPLVEGVPYSQVASLRALQRSQGWDIQSLTRVQLGLEAVERCHHITMNQTIKGGPLSHRVRVCKRCCNETSHIELGTYLDQESAMLVNDAHEILHSRHAKLLILTPQDASFLHMFSARRYNRGKVEVKSVLEILKERELEREQRKSAISMTNTTLKRRRTAANDPYVYGDLVTIPTTPSQLVYLDKDSLIHKLSPVLERMAAHATLTFRKHDIQTFHDRFRFIFSKVITPSMQSDPPAPFEHMLAGVTTVLLSAYGDSTDNEIGFLLDAISKAYPVVEDQELFLRASELMEEVRESYPKPDLHVVQQALGDYVSEIKNMMWKCLQDSKYPRTSRSDPIPSDEVMLAQASELIAVSERKRLILARIRDFLLELPNYYDSSYLEQDCIKHMIKLCGSSLCWYSVGIISFRLRQIDLTDNLEHADVALQTLDHLGINLDDLSSLEQLHLLLHKLAIYNRIYSKRKARGTNSTSPPDEVRSTFAKVLQLAKKLGLLPYSKEMKEASSEDLVVLSEKMGIDRAMVNELKCLLYGYIFEYSHIHAKSVQWPPHGLQFTDLTADFRLTLRAAQEDALQQGILFVFPYPWRALYIAMDACVNVCFESPKCFQCVVNLCQMCLNVLTEGGKRFGYAKFYADRAEDVMRKLHTLQLESITQA